MNRNDRTIVGLAMVSHALVHTYELSIPILMTIWLDEFAVSAGRLGLVVSFGYALFGLGAIPAGILADRFGSRRIIGLTLFGMGIAFVLLSLAPGIPLIALGLVIWGAAASFYHPSGLSLLSKGVNERGTAFAYHGMAGNVGIAVGPLLATLLLLFATWNTVVLVLAIPAILAGFVALRIDFDEAAAVEGETDPRTESVGSIASFIAESKELLMSAFLAVIVMMMLSGLYYRGFLTFLPEVLSTFPMFEPIEIGGRSLEPSRYLYTVLLMFGLSGQYVGGKLTDRMPTERALTASYIVQAILALVFIPASNAGLLPFVLVGIVVGFFLFVVQPLYQATVAEYTPAGTRGLSYGFTYTGAFGVGAAGAAIAGGVLEFFNAGALFVVLAGFALGAASLAFYLTQQ
ncbi:MAG: MFS transporter [Halodesulfurarchaeum sp.]